jgi:acyl CoA:acetate/3-ketoacid CoA transferase alpha subunit/acyl CoA:acetate/3-ketoacid CoA transferase beta subunit
MPKVVPLDEAVNQAVEPGMSLHLTLVHSRPNALIWEIVRRFWGTQPGLTLIANGVTGPAHALVHGGLVARIVSAFCGDVFPSANPHPIYQQAFVDDDVELEVWSMLTLHQRIRAAAEGHPYAPTRSLAGSSMEANEGVIRLPDGSLAVAALAPDLSLVHAAAADEDGNVLFTAPFGEGAYGAMAARQGAMVTVERLVSREYVRRHSHLVRIPGTYVKSVSVAPYGAHPQGLSNQGLSDLGAYDDDYAFQDWYAETSRDRKRFTQWIETSLVGRTHDDYLSDLPTGRLDELSRRSAPATRSPDRNPVGRSDAPPTKEERTACAAAQVVADRVRERRYEHLLAGLGVAHLAGWLFQRKAPTGASAALMAEIGMVDFEPQEGESFIFHLANVPTCAVTTDIPTVLGILVQSSDKGLGILSAAQIDPDGNLNSTWVAGRYIVGSGGANDVASVAAEIIAVVPQHPRRIVDRLEYVTSPGRGVSHLVTDLAVYRLKPSPCLIGVIDQGTHEDISALVDNALARLPWEVAVDPEPRLYRVDPEDVRQLRAFDPHRRFLGPLPTSSPATPVVAGRLRSPLGGALRRTGS